MSDSHLVPTLEAAARLGIRPESLYAYVSRGIIRSQRRDGHKGSWFDPRELDALARRGRGSESRPDFYIESRITLIENGHFWYRGHDAIDASKSHSFEEIAELLWSGTTTASRAPWLAEPSTVEAVRRALTTLPTGARIIELIRLAVAASAPHDHLRTDLRPESVADTGRRLLATVLASLPGRHDQQSDVTISERVWAVLHRDEPDDAGLAALDLTLCLMADHELAASTSAARIAASFRANPYHVVTAGLGTLSGALHGGASRYVDRLLAEAETEGAAAAVGQWMGEGLRIPGLGHPLYDDGDPRAKAILEELGDMSIAGPATTAAFEVAELTAQRGLPAPNVDFALGALSRSLRFERGSAESIMAIARTVGWIAHAIEEYEKRSDIRMRAMYSGPRPHATRHAT